MHANGDENRTFKNRLKKAEITQLSSNDPNDSHQQTSSDDSESYHFSLLNVEPQNLEQSDELNEILKEIFQTATEPKELTTTNQTIYEQSLQDIELAQSEINPNKLNSTNNSQTTTSYSPTETSMNQMNSINDNQSIPNSSSINSQPFTFQPISMKLNTEPLQELFNNNEFVQSDEFQNQNLDNQINYEEPLTKKHKKDFSLYWSRVLLSVRVIFQSSKRFRNLKHNHNLLLFYSIFALLTLLSFSVPVVHQKFLKNFYCEKNYRSDLLPYYTYVSIIIITIILLFSFHFLQKFSENSNFIKTLK